MAPPEPRPMTQEVGFQIPYTPHDPKVPSRPMGVQGIPDPFELQNHGGGHGTGNQVLVANNKVNHQHGQPQPQEASSIDLPEPPTPPKFKSWRSAIRRVVAAASTQPQAAFQWVLMVEVRLRVATLLDHLAIRENLLLELLWTKVKDL
eukprot:34838-Amphidinium_carterae.1